jgi:hypothetical protein
MFLSNNLTKEIVIRLIKITDIFTASFIFIILAVLISIFCDTYIFPTPKEDDVKKKSLFLIVFEISFIVGISGIIAYFIRNIFQLIPFPLEGIYGYHHLRVSEVRSASLFMSYFIILNVYLQDRISIIKKKFEEHYKK